jgi:2-keto-3-deoxy-galactonokinase
LLGTFDAAQLPSYLSGLLIAHELLEANLIEQVRGRAVHLIGSPTLIEAYAFALRQFDIATEPHDETLAAQGLFALARSRGLVGGAP